MNADRMEEISPQRHQDTHRRAKAEVRLQKLEARISGVLRSVLQLLASEFVRP